MKRIILAAGLGLGVLAFTMAGATGHITALTGHSVTDTVPQDTTVPDQPTPDQPTPDTTSFPGQ